MSDDLEQKLLAGGAYRIFSEELKKHLAFAEALLAAENWSGDQVSEAIARFHTVRGGAGFFKFSDLARVSGEIEHTLADADPSALTSIIAELKEKVGVFCELAVAIPPPTQPPPV